MGKGTRGRSTRRLNARAAELRELAEFARGLGVELKGSTDPEDRKAAAFWLSAAATMYRNTVPPVDPGTGALEALVRGRDWADARIDETVQQLRAADVSWQRIGWAVGLTPAGARKRFSRTGAA